MTQEPSPLHCCETSCTRRPLWTITARDSDGTACTVVYACAWHGDQARHKAWLADRVQVVETRETKGEDDAH